MGQKIGIVIGGFHKDLVTQMLGEARDTAALAGLEIIEEVWVPGSVEKPLAMKRMLLKPEIAGVVVLGIIEKGQTKHGFTMGQSLMHFVMQLQLDFMKPIGLGVLGPDIDPDQMPPRAKPYAKAAVEAVAIMLK